MREHSGGGGELEHVFAVAGVAGPPPGGVVYILKLNLNHGRGGASKSRARLAPGYLRCVEEGKLCAEPRLQEVHPQAQAELPGGWPT